MQADIEAIVLDRFPRVALIEGGANLQQALLSSMPRDRPRPTTTPIPQFAEIQALRRQLATLPAAELAEMGATSRASTAARQAADRQALVRAKEAKRFYNQPTAAARFDVWSKADFWQLDEAVALLLGRDPMAVNPASLAHELTQSPGWLSSKPERSDFHRRFDDLRLLLGRTEALPGPHLKPVDVVAWAHRTGAIVVPPKLAALMTPIAPEPLPPPTKQSDTSEAGVRQVWKGERLAALAAYRRDHGTKAAAEKFQISQGRVRQLLPAEPAKPAPASPFAGLISGAKRSSR